MAINALLRISPAIIAYGPDWENTRPRGTDGFFIKQLEGCVANYHIARMSICHLVSSICTCASFVLLRA
jgi:hypothetical protein